MFKMLLKNKKAQQTAEYAILIALVVGAVIAMQTYAQRSIQARIRGASQYLTSVGTVGSNKILGDDAQYEPYYLKQDYEVVRDETTEQTIDPMKNQIDSSSTEKRTRMGGQNVSFCILDEGNW